ncbi:hypothetical protein KEJ34_04000 [Candidatus Bathyarchaeota archaeon]|nr:hypothetical protein [Candidatus Bathyarchaeota archaeon]
MIRRVTVVLLTILMLTTSTGFMRQGQGTGFNLSITIDKIDISGLTVHLEGSARGINFPGSLAHYQVQVDWGDGHIYNDSRCSFTSKDLDDDGKEDDFEGYWVSDPDHTYERSGNYTITAKLYHQKPPGAESGLAQIQVTIYVSEDKADIAIQKVGPKYAHVGETITYIYNVANSGPASATGVTVIDDKAGNAIYVSGDTNENGHLDVGENWIFTANYTVLITDPDSLNNTATVTSNISDPDESNNEDSWTVDILKPSIIVKKSANVTSAHVGDVIEYTINVTNIGDCALHNVNVTDSLLGDLLTNGVLDAGKSIIFTYTVNVGDQEPLVNNIIASGKDALGFVVSSNASVSIGLIAKYNITFSQLGLDNTADSNATCLVINGTSIKVSDLPLSMLVDEGAILEFSYSNVSSTVEGKRFILSLINASSPLTVNGSKLVIGNYKTQHKLTTNVSPAGAGSISVDPLSPDGYYDAGTNVSALATSSSGYAFSHWLLDGDYAGSNIHMNVTMDAPHNLTAIFTGPAYTLTVHLYESGTAAGIQGVNVTVDGTPYITNSSGSVNVTVSCGSHTVGVISSYSPSQGTQYVFANWSDSLTDNPRNVSVTGQTTLIAYMKLQYYLTVSSAYGSPYPTSGWFDAGSNINASVTSPVSGDVGVRYVCTGWTGTGSVPPSGSDMNVTFTINAPSNITWNWKAQYYLKVESIFGVTNGEGWYDEGAIAYAGLNTGLIESDGTRHVFIEWTANSSGTNYVQSNPIIMNAPKTAKAVWKTQYYLTMQSSPSEGGSVSPSSGWYDAGSTVTVSASPSPSWAFERWVGFGSGSYNGTSSSADITINNPINQTAYFYTFSVSVSPSVGSVVQGESATATVTVTLSGGYSSEISVSLSASGLPSGASSSFSPISVTVSPSSPTATSTMTILTSSTTPAGTYLITVTGLGGGLTRTTSYMLTVTEAPPAPPSTATVTFLASGLGLDASGTVLMVDGGSYIYGDLPKSFTWEVGSSHAFEWITPVNSTVNGKRYIWVSISGLSTDRSGSIIVPARGGFVNATYKTQYYLTVISPYDAPSGEGWYDAGSEAYASLAVGMVNLTSGMRAVFVGWSGDASGTGLVSDPIIMDAPKTAVANWVIQWFIDVEVSPEEVGSVPGEGWYNNCTTITFEAPEYLPSGDESGGVRYRFDYWEVDGERFDSNVISVHANASHTITSIYVIQYSVIFNQIGLDQSADEAVVTVNGSEKKFEDLPFTLWVDYGALVNYTYEDVVSSNVVGKQFKLENITGPSSPITVTSPANVTGNYQTLYYLLVVSEYGSPRGSGWYPSGSEARFGVTTPVDHGNRTLRVFLNWYGDVNIFDPEGSILMIKPSTVIASWETQYLVTFNTTLPNRYVLRVPGVPETLPPGMDVFGMYYPAGEHITVGPAPTIVPGDEGVRYTLTGWILDGEIFTYDANMSFVVKKPHDVAVLYDTEYLLNVSAVGVNDPFTATVTISSSASITSEMTRELTPTSPIQEWFRQGTGLALTSSTPNKIGYGYWAIFKEWAGHLQAVNRTIIFAMLSPRNLNAVFFKVNPVAESIPYSIVAGLISMLLCTISARRRVSNGRRRRSATSGIIVSAVALIVAMIVSIIIATGYGININELLDFTNWAVIFLIFEAVIFALVSAAIVRKVQRRKEAPSGEP